MDDSFDELARMPGDLERLAAELPEDAARRRPHDDAFAFVEHVWHLADLEREGFAERIRRLLSESSPVLPDFDGARIARERDYRSLALAEGLATFTRARAANVTTLRSCSAADRARGGTQEGVGSVTLGEIPGRMLEHDRSHRGEIEELCRWIRS
ncbi:MAG TPA: DinB family protein [Thermoanaerobaculia bacterium]|nr:DinB family protein [Thermoanaerobaculia bacterium]